MPKRWQAIIWANDCLVYWHDLTLNRKYKTTSMENVSTWVLDKNKEHYLRCKDKAEKLYDVLRHIQLHMSKYKKKIYYPLCQTYSP